MAKKPDAKSASIPAEITRLVQNAHLLRSELLNKLMDGKNRDMDSECGYPPTLAAAMYKNFYDREGVAKRVVRCFPEESWALAPRIFETEESDETEFEKAWDALEKSMHLLHYLHRIDEMSGIGAYGILLLGLDDGKELQEPVEGLDDKGGGSGSRERKLIYLRALDESVLKIQATENDPTNPRYGQPTLYSVSFKSDTDTAVSSQRQNVHWHRVIHVADNREVSEVMGVPRMQSVFNRIFDIRKILSSSGEMFWRGAFPGYSFEVAPELMQQGVTIDTDSLRDEMANYSNGLQRYLALTGVTVKAISPQVEDPTGHVDAQLKNIAISLSIPFRVLFGSEQAKLASSQDAKAWNKRVARRQKDYLNPLVIYPFIDRLIAIGVLPEPASYDVTWPDLMSPDDTEKATLGLTRTEALAKYMVGGVDLIIPPREFLIHIIGLGEKQADVLIEASGLYNQDRAVSTPLSLVAGVGETSTEAAEE